MWRETPRSVQTNYLKAVLQQKLMHWLPCNSHNRSISPPCTEGLRRIGTSELKKPASKMLGHWPDFDNCSPSASPPFQEQSSSTGHLLHSSSLLFTSCQLPMFPSRTKFIRSFPTSRSSSGLPTSHPFNLPPFTRLIPHKNNSLSILKKRLRRTVLTKTCKAVIRFDYWTFHYNMCIDSCKWDVLMRQQWEFRDPLMIISYPACQIQRFKVDFLILSQN